MDVGKLTVEVRSAGGKNEARRLRAAGKVPGICYGRGGQPLPIALDAKALRGSLDPEKKQNTVIRMTVNGTAEGARELTVMLKDYQIDGLRREVRHVDFISIDVTKDVTVEVPIILTGKPVGGDILRRKKSLPVVYGLQRSEELRQLYARAEIDVSAAMTALEKIGARDYAEALAAEHHQRALHALATTGKDNTATQALYELVNKLLRRSA